MAKQLVNPSTLWSSRGFGFSQAVVGEAGRRLVHCSGQTAWDTDMNLVGEGDLARQAEYAFHNVGLALEAAGAGPEDVVRMRMYVVDYQPEDVEAVTGAARAFFGDHLPASTLLGVQALAIPGFLIEVEVTAEIE